MMNMTPLPITDGDDGDVTPLTCCVNLEEDFWLEPLLQLSSMMLLSQSSDEGLLASDVVVILQNNQPINEFIIRPEQHTETANLQQCYIGCFVLCLPGGSTIFGNSLRYPAMVNNPSILSWIQMLIQITTKHTHNRCQPCLHSLVWPQRCTVCHNEHTNTHPLSLQGLERSLETFPSATDEDE